MRKIILFLFIFISIILSGLFLITFIYKDQIENKIISEINNQLNGEIKYQNFSFGLLPNPLDPHVKIEELIVENESKVKIIHINNIEIHLSLGELFNKKLSIKNLLVKGTNIHLTVNQQGKNNFAEILKDNNQEKIDKPDSERQNNDYVLSLKNYEISDLNLHYINHQNKQNLEVEHLNLNGNSSFQDNTLLLINKTKIQNISFAHEENKWINNWNLESRLNLAYDLAENKLNLKENSFKLNDLLFSIIGDIQINDKGISTDLNIDTKDLNFKNFISLIPSAYTSDFHDLEAKGNFNLKGYVKGLYNDKYIPSFDLAILTENSSLRYPSLPGTIENIAFDIDINNPGNQVNDILVDVNYFNFKVLDGYFKAAAHLNEFENLKVKANLKTSLSLKALTDAYPLPIQQLIGQVKTDISANFDLGAISNKNYQNIKLNGFVNSQNLSIKYDSITPKIDVPTAKVNLNNNELQIDDFEFITNKQQLKLNGKITNAIAYALDNQMLDFNFNVSGDQLNINKLMPEMADSESSEENNTNQPISEKDQNKTLINDVFEPIIPKNINGSINLNIASLTYDHYRIQNTKAIGVVKDQKISFRRGSGLLYDGKMNFDGSVDLSKAPIQYTFNFSLNQLDLAKSANEILLFEKLAPISKALNAKVSTNMKVIGFLNSDFSADLSSINGNMDTSTSQVKFDKNKSNFLQNFDNQVDFVDLDLLKLTPFKTNIAISEGKVNFEPFKIANYKNSAVFIGGSHSFDNDMNYTIETKIPVNDLGGEVAQLVKKLPETDRKKLHLPVKLYLSGAPSKPNIKPDLKYGMKSLTQQVISSQKNKLLNNIGKAINIKKDTSNNGLEKKAKNILKNLFK